MLELSRGYAAAAIDAAERSGGAAALGEVAGDLAALLRLVGTSAELRAALTDPSIPSQERRAVMEELLEGKISHEALALCGFAVGSERAAELPKVLEQLVELTESRAAEAAAGERDLAEQPIGRGGAYERLRGYAEHEFEAVADAAHVDEVEDEIFSFARILEGSREMREGLSDADVPARRRVALLEDVLDAKVSSESVHLCCYVVRAGRIRDVVGALGFLVDLAAEERGRRVAKVHAALPLDEAARARLGEALSRLVRRPVELRVAIDPAVIGGIEVEVGNTVIDGTVRHRLGQLRETLAKGA
ncbi:MAG: ATP synthase F1 subunit delta [Acidimicrobiales bacterium]